MLKTATETETKEFHDCHDGQGLTIARLVLGHADSACGIQFMHDDLLVPGASIGEHPHHQEEEIYYIVSGRGHFIYDGQKVPAETGAVLVCSPGHSHGIINTSDAELRLLVFNVRK